MEALVRYVLIDQKALGSGYAASQELDKVLVVDLAY